MEFSDIDEGIDSDEVSPILPPKPTKGYNSNYEDSRRHTMNIGDKRQNANLRNAVLALQKNKSLVLEKNAKNNSLYAVGGTMKNVMQSTTSDAKSVNNDIQSQFYKEQ